MQLTFRPWLVLAATLGFASLAQAKNTAIDCTKAQTADEKTICENYGLGQLDARMATLYEISTSLVAMGQRGDIRDAQTQWLKHRQACGKKVDCLRKLYEERITQLQQVMDRIVAKGPY